MDPRPSGPLERALSWTILLGLTLWLAWTWAPAFGLPFGDSHEGRILSEFGIRVRNFWEMGAAGSSWGGDWTPFRDTPYNHHPPFLHALHIGLSALFGQSPALLKSVGYVSGLLTVPALAYMARRLGLRPLTAAVATALVAVTPFFWLYARLGLGMLPLALMTGTVLHLAATAEPSKRLVIVTSAAAFFAVTSSWQGLILGAVLGLWLLSKRRIDQPTIVVGITMSAAALIVVAWTLTGPGIGDLAAHAGARWSFPWTLGEFLDRQWFFADALLPDGYRWLMIAALPVGLAHRATRFVVWMFVLLIVGFMFGPSDNAWIHDYWNLYGFLAVVPAVGITLDVVCGGTRDGGRGTKGRTWWYAVVVAAMLVLAVVWSQEIERDLFHDRYFEMPARAGALLESHEPAPGQETGWYLNPIPHVTWMAYHWDLEPVEVTPNALTGVPDGDLVLVRTDRLPQWLSPALVDAAVAADGRYALVPAGALDAFMLDEEG